MININQVITSQHHRSEDIVQEKINWIKEQNITEIELPVYEIGIDDLYLLADGHHRYEAAQELEINILFKVVRQPEDLTGINLLEQFVNDGQYHYLLSELPVW